MATGYGLQNLMQSPMAGGQQGQFPDPNDIVSQIMEQFAEYVRKRGTGAVPSGGGQGIQQPMAQQSPLALGGGGGAGAASGMPAIQPPVGTTPYAKAGGMRDAGMEGVGAMMEQAGETAAEPWKPKALDIGLMAATIALPIIAAMQPEGRGRRGQRKQQRMSELFKTLGGVAGQGLGMRMESFKTGKEATFGAAKTRAEMAGEEVEAKYEHTLGGIDLERDIEQQEFENRIAQGRLDIAGLPKADKPTWSDLKVGGLGGLSPEEQKDVLYPGLEPTGQLSESQRGNYALKMIDSEIEDVLIKANQKYQALDKGLRDRLGGGSITGFIQLENIASRLAEGGIDIKDSWFTGDYAADSTLQGLVDDYNEALQRKRDLLKRLSGQGGQTGLGQGMGGNEFSPEEIEAEIARRKVSAGH